MRTDKPVLEVQGLGIERGNAQIIRDISWRVNKGEHWVILGRNGCGKTSLLRALLGYLSPTRGEIQVLGRTYGETDWRELRLLLGMVSSALQISIPPAEPAIETVMSGKFAQLDLWAPTTKADEKHARKWLRTLEVEYLSEREWMFLSQGERQRVLIARALMAHPKLLILDEPCAGLDPVSRQDFLGSVESLARQRNGPSLVLVTHHVEEITPSFSHALLLRTGETAAAGPIEEVLTNDKLSLTFGVPCTIQRGPSSYALHLAARGSRSSRVNT